MQPNGNMPGVGQPVGPAKPANPVNPVNSARPARSVTPTAPATSASEPTFDNGPSVVDGKGSKKTGWILAVVLLLIVAIGGVGFGVWAMMDGNTQKEQLNSQISTLKKQNSELQSELDNSDVDTADYIYVGEWGLKIKIPEELKWVGYQYITNGGDGTCDEISVTGAIDKDGQTPDFVRTFINSDASFQGSIMRCTGDVEIRYYSAGVDLNDEYEYYYNIKQSALSESQREWDSESTNLIQEMLINPENYSEI